MLGHLFKDGQWGVSLLVSFVISIHFYCNTEYLRLSSYMCYSAPLPAPAHRVDPCAKLITLGRTQIAHDRFNIAMA